MKRLLAALLAAACTVSAQAAAGVRPQGDGDLCHVYVVDVLKAQKAEEEYRSNPEKDYRALKAAVVVFPDFRTVRAEEELTTKTYHFPGSRFYLTAGVFYTDESMASAAGFDSMLLAVGVSRRPLKNAGDVFSSANNAVAELTAADTDAARVKQYVRVGGRLYLVGLQCNSKQVCPTEDDAPQSSGGSSTK